MWRLLFAATVLAALVGMDTSARALAGVQPPAQKPSFSAKSELVVLHVTVTDRHGRFIGSLPMDAFHVLEEGRPQTIDFFAEQDTPASVALLIDGSGSMMKSRDLIVAGITGLADASHPEDEFLPLPFNEKLIHVLPASAPFTRDRSRLRNALTEGLGARGLTALHDSLIAALGDLDGGSHERKVLIVLSDGGDNASHASFDAMMRKVLASNVVIYGVSIEDPQSIERDPETLRKLARATGGIVYEPRRTSDVMRVLQEIAADIRSRYTLAYVPGVQTVDGDLRQVTVRVDVPGRSGVRVRTRTGYVPGDAVLPAHSQRRGGAK
jgi:VWFA-related protein